MRDNTIPTDELNQLPREMLVILYTNLSESFRILSEQNGMIQKQNEQLISQVEDLKEQLAILTQHRFGPRSERNLQTEGQLSIDLENMCVLNEAECLVEEGLPEETAMEEVLVRRKPRAKGRRALNQKDIETVIVIHECPEEELAGQFPHGWHALPDEVYKELKYVPGRFEVHEHHIRVYAGDHDSGGILRAPGPARLLDHSILTPELAAAIFNAKYVNAVPLKRLSEEFLRNDVSIPRQDMEGWMIRLHEYYLGPVHERMREELLKSHHLHCDESPFTMPEHGKEYMWVCHSPGGDGGVPVYLYEYPGIRGTDALRELLKGYQGTLVTDGYQAYHTMAGEHPDDLKVAGCWAHARRKYAEIVKAAGKNGPTTPAQKTAAEAVGRIAAIYHVDNMYKDASASDRLKNRQRFVKPLVDAYFGWVKEHLGKKGLVQSSKLVGALNYSVNQEQFLRVFLEDGAVPPDNNDADRSIRSFCVGKHNWKIIDSKKGAKASAMLYSLAETAKANGLKPYEYFSYLLTQLMNYPRGNVPEDVLEKLMPWSAELPDSCRKTKDR